MDSYKSKFTEIHEDQVNLDLYLGQVFDKSPDRFPEILAKAVKKMIDNRDLDPMDPRTQALFRNIRKEF